MNDIEKEMWLCNAEAHDQMIGMLAASLFLNLITTGILIWVVVTW